jgi:hypothetical protein
VKKIPNLFERDWNGDKSRVLPIYNKTADVLWVARGEGVATVKWDGSACMVRAGRLYVRYDCKPDRTWPIGFEPCQDPDPVTGHWPGWIPAKGNPSAKWHVDAFENSGGLSLSDGTYEACGPQFQGNPHGFDSNRLIKHGVDRLDGLNGYLAPAVSELDAAGVYAVIRVGLLAKNLGVPFEIEGIVWHHPDGRMVKCLASDLRVPWKTKVRA